MNSCVLKYVLKKTGLPGSTLSGHRMTTGIGLFELPTRGLLQKEWEHSPLKSSWWSVWEACSSMVGAPVPDILSLVIRVSTAASLSC